MKKAVSLILSLVFTAVSAIFLTSCKDGATYTVGICQLAQHEALDAATRGFRDALTAKLGDRVRFDEANAAGDSNLCATIVNAFVAKKYDLILANATAALQAAYNATETIPILGTSVTDYGVALGLKNYTGTVGGNVSGTSDLAPLAEQAQMIFEWFPEAEHIGLLYCSAEPNSLYQVETVAAEIERRGKTATRYSFSDSNDLSGVVESACAAEDVLYIPTDNTAASCAGTIGNIVRERRVPVIAGEASTCAGCGVATLSIDYYDLGYRTGEMAAKILTGEKNISEMPVEYADAAKYYNQEICTELGLTPPAGYQPLGK